MFQKDFTDSFSRLGERLLKWLSCPVLEPELEEAIGLAYSHNPFFTPFMQHRALEAIARAFLQREELERWLGNYVVTPERGFLTPVPLPRVGIILAGNLPLVGFHDFLCVLACGAHAVVKLSSKDRYLLPALLRMLEQISPGWASRVTFTADMGSYYDAHPKALSALIATGSDVTREAVARRFAGIPMLLRGRRFSFAVLSGRETEQELGALASDVSLYYGMGCRSVNYLWVPRGYDFTRLCEAFSGRREQLAWDGYMNHYKRARAILAMEGETFTDGGFFLLLKTADVSTPIAVTGYAEYDSEEDVLRFENENRGHIQKKYRTFGMAQTPAIGEYADNLDTMAFILEHTY